MDTKWGKKTEGIELKVGEAFRLGPGMSESLRLIRFLGMPNENTMSFQFEPVAENPFPAYYVFTTKKFTFRGECSDKIDHKEYEFVIIDLGPESVRLDIQSRVGDPEKWKHYYSD